MPNCLVPYAPVLNELLLLLGTTPAATAFRVSAGVGTGSCRLARRCLFFTCTYVTQQQYKKLYRLQAHQLMSESQWAAWAAPPAVLFTE
jgi:hypothetical protein